MNSWLTWGYWYMFLLLKELLQPDGLPAPTHPLGRGVFNETPSLTIYNFMNDWPAACNRPIESNLEAASAAAADCCKCQSCWCQSLSINSWYNAHILLQIQMTYFGHPLELVQTCRPTKLGVHVLTETFPGMSPTTQWGGRRVISNDRKE